MPKLAILGGSPVRDLKRKPYPQYPKITQEEIEAVVQVLKEGHISSLRGSKVKEFEKAFANYIGVKHAIATSSGTTALHVAVAACGIGPGDEVIVPAYTFTSTATAVLMQCAIPIFADIDLETYTIDPEDIKRKITERTKAIIVVHLFGCPAKMDEILEIAQEHNLYVIEDCAQAIGAEYKGKKVGSLGDIACFSFYESKNMMTGEGGMITTNNDELAEIASMLRNHAEIRGLKEYLKKKPITQVTNMLGYNYRMTELQAAIGLVQLKKLDKMNEKRNKLAKILTEELQEIDFIKTPIVPDYAYHVFHLYCLKYYEEKTGVNRDLFFEALKAEGALVSKGYTEPLYLNPLYQYKLARKHGCPFTCPYYKGKVEYSKGICSNAEELAFKRAIWVGIHSELSEQDIQDIATAFKKVAQNLHELKQLSK